MNLTPSYLEMIDNAIIKGRLPQSMLLAGPLHFDFDSLITQMAQRLVCRGEASKPCRQCSDCEMVERNEHPDFEWIKAEKKGGTIKIDQIRELQNSIFLSPQRAPFRLFVIESSDRMNRASSNALLKILEEPPEHTVFVLIAEQVGTILPTILSRCHVYRFDSAEEGSANHFLSLGTLYPTDSDRGKLFQSAAEWVQVLANLIDQKTHVCEVAAKWSKYDFADVLWFLYILYAETLKQSLVPQGTGNVDEINLHLLSKRLNPRQISEQIYKISQLLRKISHNMNINHVLALEHLLFDLTTEQTNTEQ